jgi:hypothetical protein
MFSFAGFRTDWLRREEAMKTSGRENPTRWAAVPSDRDFGAAGQNRSRSIKGAVKQEKLQPLQWCFFLTSPFIELLSLQRFRLLRSFD